MDNEPLGTWEAVRVMILVSGGVLVAVYALAWLVHALRLTPLAQ